MRWLDSVTFDEKIQYVTRTIYSRTFYERANYYAFEFTEQIKVVSEDLLQAQAEELSVEVKHGEIRQHSVVSFSLYFFP